MTVHMHVQKSEVLRKPPEASADVSPSMPLPQASAASSAARSAHSTQSAPALGGTNRSSTTLTQNDTFVSMPPEHALKGGGGRVHHNPVARITSGGLGAVATATNRSHASKRLKLLRSQEGGGGWGSSGGAGVSGGVSLSGLSDGSSSSGGSSAVSGLSARSARTLPQSHRSAVRSVLSSALGTYTIPEE